MVPLMARRLRALAPGLARIAVFLVIVAIGLEILLGKVVRAQVDGALLDLGAGLVQLADPAEEAEDRSGPRLLELNGSQLRFETGTRAEAVGAVLDDAETGCADGADRDADGDGVRGESPPVRPERLLRGSDGERGFVACISRPRAPIAGERSPRGTGAAYRYVYAQSGDQATQVVRFWTEGALDLERLFPDRGDAPGSDAPGLPRPPGARRILSAREVGAAQQLTLYRSRGGEPGELDTWYRARLAGLGWSPLEPVGKQAATGDHVLVVGRAGSIAALVFTADEAGGSSVAILTSLDQGARKGHGPT
jgi:hypothetical protein